MPFIPVQSTGHSGNLRKKSPSSLKGFEKSIPQTVEGRIVLLLGYSEVIVGL